MRSARIQIADLALLAMLAGCTGKVDDTAAGSGGASGGEGGEGGEAGAGDGGSGDAGGDDGGTGEAGADAGGSDDDLPVAEILDVFCTVQVTGETRGVWTVIGTASDPQGADTLLTLVSDGVVVSQGETELARHPLSCSVIDLSLAECSGTFSGFGDGTSCDEAESYSVFIEAEDEDGNRGSSSSLSGRVEE